MAKKPNLLHTRKKGKNNYDPCPVCERDLYYNDSFTKRIGIVDTAGNHEVIGWICPECKSEFDKSDKLMYIYGENFNQGDA